MPRLGDFNKFYGGAMAGYVLGLLSPVWPTFAHSSHWGEWV
jgi:hypothetical protein